MLSFKYKLSLLLITLLPVLLGLGFWQLSRYQEKKELESAYNARQQMRPLSLAEVLDHDDPLYLPLSVTGQFVPDRYFLLDNQTYQGRPGYELLMPFVTDAGQWLLVNRGWLPSASRDVLPDIVTPAGRQKVTGLVYRPLGKPFLLEDIPWSSGWPRRIQALDFSRVMGALGQTLPELTLVLNKRQPGSEQYRPVTTSMKSEKHLAYAVQWFVMALVLLGLVIYRIRQPRNNRE